MLGAGVAAAQDVAIVGSGAANDAPRAAENHLVTSVPDTFDGVDVATVIGANAFYSQGYTGGGTISSNIEAGHVWDGHETLSHVTQRVNQSGVPGGSFATPAYDRHATWVGMMIGGRAAGPSPGPYQLGIASQTDLRSGAIATSWSGLAYATSFSITTTSMMTPYVSAVTGFGAADAINSSWGSSSASNTPEAAGTDSTTLLLDGMANQNPRTAFVVATGNNGGMVGSPASGYNGIAVGALQNDGANQYNAVASFSNRGPNDYRDPGQTVLAATARRAAVDIVAPGTHLTSAYYGGETGGNDPALPGPTSGTVSGANFYIGGRSGTSFASPIVTGGVALMHDAAAGEGLPADARDTRVIKANLMNAARKIPGWSNAQVAHPNGNGGVRTTDALDMNSGAGAIDLVRTYDQFINGQTDIAGTSGGLTAETVGWDFASVSVGGNTDIVITTPLTGEFRTTLSWFRERSTDTSTFATGDIGFANLNLQVWNATFTTLISESISSFSETEHLTFNLPTDGLYGLRVAYPSNVFGPLTSEQFGLAWWGTAVPEPAALSLLGMASLLALRRRHA